MIYLNKQLSSVTSQLNSTKRLYAAYCYLRTYNKIGVIINYRKKIRLIAKDMGVCENTLRRRISELKEDGWARISGEHLHLTSHKKVATMHDVKCRKYCTKKSVKSVDQVAALIEGIALQQKINQINFIKSKSKSFKHNCYEGGQSLSDIMMEITYGVKEYRMLKNKIYKFKNDFSSSATLSRGGAASAIGRNSKMSGTRVFNRLKKYGILKSDTPETIRFSEYEMNLFGERIKKANEQFYSFYHNNQYCVKRANKVILNLPN